MKGCRGVEEMLRGMEGAELGTGGAEVGAEGAELGAELEFGRETAGEGTEGVGLGSNLGTGDAGMFTTAWATGGLGAGRACGAVRGAERF